MKNLIFSLFMLSLISIPTIAFSTSLKKLTWPGDKSWMVAFNSPTPGIWQSTVCRKGDFEDIFIIIGEEDSPLFLSPTKEVYVNSVEGRYSCAFIVFSSEYDKEINVMFQNDDGDFLKINLKKALEDWKTR